MVVSEEIIKVLDYICGQIGVTIDWTAENVMPYVSELMAKFIKYEIGTSIAWMAIMTLLSIAAIFLTKRFCPVFKDGIENEGAYDYGWSVASGVAIAALVALYISTIIVIGTQIMDIVKCVTFPEMVIVEYVKTLVNSN